MPITLLSFVPSMNLSPAKSKVQGIPNYYGLYLSWSERYRRTGNNSDLLEAQRFARLAEEFGQAVIEDDETIEFPN